MQPTSQGPWEEGSLKPQNDVTTETGTDSYMEGNTGQEATNDEPLVVDYDNQMNDDEADLREQGWSKTFGAQRNCERGEDGNKEDDVIRVATYNINGFPKMNRQGTTKAARIKEVTKNIDCIGMSEINRNWLKINSQQSLYQRLQAWWKQHKTAHTWLKDYEWPSQYQQGGTSLSFTSDKISKYGQEKGEDMSGLGRWVWQTVEGHSETKSVIIQVYRPTRNTKDNGSTFMQQRVAADEEDPLKIFDIDLLNLVDGFLEDNFQIVLMGDFNINLEGQSHLEKELKARGIEDVIRTTYGYAAAPNTHKRGSHPIDAIFASDTIQITQGGYDRGRPDISDHRMIWADITMDSLLGVDRGDIQRPKAKKLQISNRVVTSRFNRLFVQQMVHHNLLAKARKLEADIGDTKTMTPDQASRYEGIDNQRCRATAFAEARCSRSPSDDTAFSLELKKALGKAIVWQQLVKKTRARQRINKRWLIDLKEDLGIPEEFFPVPITLEKAIEKSKEAFQEYQQKKQKAPELRSEFLDTLIQMAEDIGDEKKVKYLREIKAKEQLRDAHQRIKLARGKLRGGNGVRFVHRICEDGTVETIRNKNEMEAEIQAANAAKLKSANESPIRQGELQRIITDHDYDRWEAFLHGDVELPADMNEGTKLWLEKFKGISIQEEEPIITTESYIKSWNKVKEHTSCAPGALHYGTFKSIKWCRPAAELHTIMARIPVKTGYTPKRWTKSVDSMLPKKPGEWRPNKLRLTSLLMPDFNHNNKILGREAMKWAEEKGLLAPEQYGSRKRLSAEKHALNKRLVLDAMRIEKRPGVVCANDAKACYDRILHFAAYISLRRTGMKKEAVISMLEPIRRLEHVIRTAYGDSTTSYGGENWDSDPSGICQGNGAGPAIWALVSSPLLECLRQQGYGAQLTSAITKTYLHLAGFAFVDDADTVQTGEIGEDTPSVVAKAQAGLNLWEELVRATGGGLEGEKSDFAVVNYTWKNGQWSYEKPKDTTTLTVRNSDGTREPLTQLDPAEARRTLGVWQAIDGNERVQTEKLREKAREWSRAVARSSLTRHDAVFGMKTSLYPSITFGLMATTLTKNQGEVIFSPIREGALPKTGYARSMPAIMVHGPEKYGGIGIKDIYTLQGIAHIKAMLDEGDSKSATGQLIRQVIEGHTLEAGRQNSIFQIPYTEIKEELTYSWVQDTLRFMDETDIRITGGIPRLKMWRERDSFLMDDVSTTQGTHITKVDRRAFQRCRLYLRVNTLSDIVNGGGTHILGAAWKVKREWKSLSSEAYVWPYQPTPSREDVAAWQRVLGIVYAVCPRYLNFSKRLGAYYKHSRKHATWLWDRRSESLYTKHGRHWTRWIRMRRRTRTQRFMTVGDFARHTEPHWEVATVTRAAMSQMVHHEGNFPHGIPTHEEREIRDDQETMGATTAPRTLESIVRRMSNALQWSLEDISLPNDNGRAIASKIMRGKGRCISDGSVKDQLGTAAATFMDVGEDNEYIIRNRTPGRDRDIHSFRSELCGILPNILLVNSVAEAHDIQEGIVTVGCDSESALWAAFGEGDVNANDPSFDLIKTIRHHVSISPVTWRYMHVRGHQDDDKEAVLDDWALANIRMDKEAERYWMQKYGRGSRERPNPPRMQGEGWRVEIRGYPVVSQLDDRLYNHVYRDRCMNYWEQKERIGPGQGENVAWKNYHSAVSGLPSSQRQWVHKHHSGCEGTNYMLFLRGERRTPTCPNCEYRETHRHIVQCQSNRATQAYRNTERTFETWLKATTSQPIRLAIMAHLDAYRENEELVQDREWEEDILHASTRQQEIGENAFIEGLLTKEWENMQAKYLAKMESKRNPSRWVTALIRKLWGVAWDMWDSRNGEVHKNKTTRKAQVLAQLDTEIRQKYNEGQTNRFLPRLEHAFFRQNLEVVLTNTEYQKRAWLHIAKRYIERDRQRVARNRSILLMREWILPGSTGEIGRHRRRIINRSLSALRAPEGSRRRPAGREA